MTEVERQEWKARIFAVARELEHAKNRNPPIDEVLRQKTEEFEAKIFRKFPANRTGYLARMTKLVNDILAGLAKFRDEQKALAKEQPVSMKKSPNPTEIESLRAPLEKCRAILRVFNVFTDVKQVKEREWKEDFLALFTRTTTLVKKAKEKTITPEDTVKEIMDIRRGLEQLRCKLEPRFQEIMKLCQATTEEEVIALDLKPFAFLERITQNHGTEKIARRCSQASWILGGHEVSKRVKTMESPEPAEAKENAMGKKPFKVW